MVPLLVLAGMSKLARVFSRRTSGDTASMPPLATRALSVQSRYDAVAI
ncbi:MAG: hypothetical protein U5O16_01420 [Rhodococcus sp. (in: high G+C Gram-positive bacteria)]|nr:hypothetical protein [Rhodococcus sp. (in: high G+C Gram-positive bacteria)]